MRIKTKRRILYVLLFFAGIWLWVQIGGWSVEIGGWLGDWSGPMLGMSGPMLGMGGAYLAGAWLAEKFGWRRTSSAFDAFENWSDAKKQEAANYGYVREAILEAANYGDVLNAIIIAMLAKLAKLDGKVTKNEIATVERILREIDLAGDARKAAVELFQQAKNGPLSFYETVLIAKHYSGSNPQAARLIILFCIQLGHADGDISDRVCEALEDACSVLGFRYEKILEAFAASNQQESTAAPNTPSHTESAYGILGCAPSDSDDAIKSKYRTLAKTFHPDTIASKALPPEFTKFAEERFKQIQSAYESVMESRGRYQSS